MKKKIAIVLCISLLAAMCSGLFVSADGVKADYAIIFNDQSIIDQTCYLLDFPTDKVEMAYDANENAMKVTGINDRGYFMIDLEKVFGTGTIDADVYKYIVVRAKANDTSRQFCILYYTDTYPNPGANGDWQDLYTNFAGAGSTNNLVFDASARASYDGTVELLRFDPWFYEGTGKEMYIESIGFCKTLDEAQNWSGEAVTEIKKVENTNTGVASVTVLAVISIMSFSFIKQRSRSRKSS